MTCFRDEGDNLVYLALLRQIARRGACALHAYCVMGNHVHLLVTPAAADSCSKLMKALAQRYSYYFNQKYKRTGPLWEGRFKSCVVESSRYVLACYRYVELNPVRAKIVGHPAAYLWSSYAANSGIRGDADVRPHDELLAIGTQAYVRLVEEALDDRVIADIREATKTGYALDGTSAEARRGKPGRPSKKSVSDTDLDLFSGGAAS